MSIWRRAASSIIAVLAVLGASAALAGPAVAACSPNHCYGIATNSHSGVKGGRATIDPYYLSSATGYFTTDEVWLVASSSSYWVEVGYIRNFANIDGVSQGLHTFWYDSRPGGGTHGHVFQTNPSLTARTFYVMQNSSTSYTVTDGTYYGTSSSNTMTPAAVHVGSETSTASACSRAHDYNMTYSTGSGWVNFTSPAGGSPDSPQKVVWLNYPYNMEAGVWC